MGYAQAETVKADQIPVIDITPLRNGSDKLKVAKALHAASQGLGFIYVRGHGIPANVIEAARASAFEFFSQSDDIKSKVRVSKSHRGWLGRNGATMKTGVKPDLKESFIWGRQMDDGAKLADHPLRGPNQWPVSLPAMQDHAMAYFRAVHDVAVCLMRGFATGLDLDENFFLATSSRPLSRASFVYYPQQPEALGEQQFGVGPHTDFGVLTVLCQDSVGGLQVQDINGNWVHAPPIEGSLVVNVGDLLSRWTAGAYKSTPHRVINSSGQERLSLVLAYDPDPETVIDSRQVFGAGFAAPDDPITCGDYLTWRFNKAFSYRKE